MARSSWEPPAELARDEIVRISRDVLSRPERAIVAREYVFRMSVLGLDWDIGGMTYEPRDGADVAIGADGRKVGMFLLHGGASDHRAKDSMGRLLAARFGYKVATMTYPGHLYLLDPARDWPGDTLNPDGTARTPLWNIDEPITPDQYELVEDRSDPVLRAKYGTIFFLKAREGTDFYNRMAAWPVAFEEAMEEVCRRNFPGPEYSIYPHGHSTGGPFVHMLLQRVDNVAGLAGMETSCFGLLSGSSSNQGWDFPFNYMMVRTWRDEARYAGPEAGEAGIRRLPMLMEEVFEAWNAGLRRPGFKEQHFVTFAAFDALADAARVTSRRLGLDPEATAALIERFQDYPRPLAGPGARPVPPLLYGINAGSRDHTLERYRDHLLPALAELRPAPKARLTLFRAGVHDYERPEEDLPHGTLPAVADLWDRAIRGGYYLVDG